MKLKLKGSSKLYRSIPMKGFKWLREVQGDNWENHQALNELLDIGLVELVNRKTERGAIEFAIVRK